MVEHQCNQGHHAGEYWCGFYFLPTLPPLVVLAPPLLPPPWYHCSVDNTDVELLTVSSERLRRTPGRDAGFLFMAMVVIVEDGFLDNGVDANDKVLARSFAVILLCKWSRSHWLS